MQKILDDEKERKTPYKKALSRVQNSDESTSRSGPRALTYVLAFSATVLGLIGFVSQVYMSTSFSSVAEEFSKQTDRFTG